MSKIIEHRLMRGFVWTMPNLVLLMGGSGVALAQATFQPVGTLGGASSKALGVSPDGSVVVGESVDANGKTQAFMWTSGGGIVGIGFLDATNQYSTAADADKDSLGLLHVAGTSKNSSNLEQAFEWSGPIGGPGSFTAIPPLLAGGKNYGASLAVDAADQVFVVGRSQSASATDPDRPYEAYRWRTGSPTESLALGFLGGNLKWSEATGTGVNASGQQIVVGYSWSSWGGISNNAREGFRWFSGDSNMAPMRGPDYVCSRFGDVPLDPTGGGDTESLFNACSRDGRFAVGRGTYPNNPPGGYFMAYMHDTADQDSHCQPITKPLGFIPGGDNHSEAFGVTIDGEVVVGTSWNDTLGYRAFLWVNGLFNKADSKANMVNLKTFLESVHGLNLTGWTLTDAMDVSDGGSGQNLTIVGFGVFDPDGAGGQPAVERGWVATIPDPVQSGGCCNANSAGCTESRPGACEVDGGKLKLWAGAGISCGQTDCLGSCCQFDGSCDQQIPANCRWAPGSEDQRFNFYGGVGSSCSGRDCAVACCLPDTSCVEESVNACRADLGTFPVRPGSSCNPPDPDVNCSDVVTGSCCNADGSCTDDIPSAYCADPEGFGRWQEATACGSRDCTGACCGIAGSCAEGRTINDCTASGYGSFLGYEASCASANCPVVCYTPIWADADQDSDVDQVDFGVYQLCYTGGFGSIPSSPEYCRCFDRDGNEQVDGTDLDAFEKCATGPAVPWSGGSTPDCIP